MVGRCYVITAILLTSFAGLAIVGETIRHPKDRATAMIIDRAEDISLVGMFVLSMAGCFICSQYKLYHRSIPKELAVWAWVMPFLTLAFFLIRPSLRGPF